MNPRSVANGSAERFHSLSSLLSAAGVSTVEELGEELHQNEDVDTRLMLTDYGILLYTPASGTELVFPFTWEDFWFVLERLETPTRTRPTRCLSPR